MGSVITRILVGLAAAPLALLIHPWTLQSWPYDVAFGAVIFGVMHMCAPMQYSIRDACVWLGFTMVLWVVSTYILPHYGLSPASLPEDSSTHRALRRFPDVVVTTLTFAAIASAFAAFNPAITDDAREAI